MISVGPPLLAVAFVLAGALVYEPHILTLRWLDGHEERIAATSPSTCETAARAISAGLWRMNGGGQPSATCAPGDLFTPASRYIEGFNMPRGLRP